MQRKHAVAYTWARNRRGVCTRGSRPTPGAAVDSGREQGIAEHRQAEASSGIK